VATGLNGNLVGVVKFGVYEVDPHAGELRRNGVKIKLQEQPFQVLTMLLERPGEVISREELQGRLWPADTFVDFDHSLNAAIKRLRDALRDSADNPRFVETLARRGYRFVAPVKSGGDGWARTRLYRTLGCRHGGTGRSLYSSGLACRSQQFVRSCFAGKAVNRQLSRFARIQRGYFTEWKIPGLFRPAGSFPTRAGHRRVTSPVGTRRISSAWLVLASRWSASPGDGSEWSNGKAKPVECFHLGRASKKNS
jgi:DNA-binding winged helix-turn-helix (wHTH) protein